MDSKELHEINFYCTPTSILIVKQDGELARLNCPFCVVVIKQVGGLQTGVTCDVNQVKVDANLILVYIIKNKGYYYWNFAIII